MIHIERFTVNMVEENCYVVSDESNEAVIIDCGAMYEEEYKAIAAYIDKKSLRVVHLLQTHAHFDHILGDSFVYDRWKVLPEMHELEVSNYRGLDQQLLYFLQRPLSIKMPEVGKVFREGDVITFGHHKLEVIHTPGHTPGGVCFWERNENVLFSGDSLFLHSIGRTDFPHGNHADLVESLRSKVLTLPSETVVFPGHGDSTTIGDEIAHNSFLR